MQIDILCLDQRQMDEVDIGLMASYFGNARSCPVLLDYTLKDIIEKVAGRSPRNFVELANKMKEHWV